jgi:magnesium chelatase accessory protein
MTSRLVWERDGRDWPNRAASRFVLAGGMRWHVQVAGDGPVALLAHGTGAATHSWRGLLPLLAERFRVIAPDLPGHGFTQSPPRAGLSLPGMAAGVAALLRELGLSPALTIGHSAGAAILARMALDGQIAPAALVSLNGALLPLFGLTGQVFSGLAKLMVGIPLMPRLFARQAADPETVRRLLAGTGSSIDAAGAEFYRRVAGNRAHAEAALGMMANWDLDPLQRELPRLPGRLTLVVGAHDRTIRPSEAIRVRQAVPGAQIVTMPGLGHLAHEEQPRQTVEIIVQAAREAGIIAT